MLELKYTHYTGTVNDKGKGIFNFNTTVRNGERDHDASLDIGEFSYSMGLTSRSIGYGGYSFNFNANIIDGITWGGNYTDENGNISGGEYTINPYKIIPVIPVVAAAAYLHCSLLDTCGVSSSRSLESITKKNYEKKQENNSYPTHIIRIGINSLYN